MNGSHRHKPTPLNLGRYSALCVRTREVKALYVVRNWAHFRHSARQRCQKHRDIGELYQTIHPLRKPKRSWTFEIPWAFWKAFFFEGGKSSERGRGILPRSVRRPDTPSGPFLMSAEFSTQPINPSYLTSPKNWPTPTGTPQATRPATVQDCQLVQACAHQLNVLDQNFRKQVRANAGTIAERLNAILCSGTLNFNGGRVRAAVGPRIEAACAAAEPVRIVMPAFCRIGNTAKLMYSLRPTAAEAVSLGHLGHIARSLSTLYSPGVQFVMLTDARLYGPRLLNPVPTVAAYNKSLHEICSNVAPSGEVKLIEYDNLLGDYASEFEHACQRGMQRVAAEDPEMFAELSREDLYESVRASLNTSTLGMTYHDLFECFSYQRNPKNRFYKLLAEQTEESIRTKMAMRFACHELEGCVLTNQFGPNYIRATIHVSRSTPVLGLRIYPDYKRSSDQLPYHGVPLIYREGERIKMLVAPETRFWRDGTLERVTHQNGETYFYQSRIAQ